MANRLFMNEEIILLSTKENVMSKCRNQHMMPISLKTNACIDPLGIDMPHPLFQWMIRTSQENCYQSAYRIVVVDESGKTVWDTGKVYSDRQLQIKYRGKKLHAMTRYDWRVMVWDQEDSPSDWSKQAGFETGMLQLSDWKAQWIGGNSNYNPLEGLPWIGCDAQPGQTVDFAFSFCVRKPLQQAIFDGTAFERWEFFCNGTLCFRINTEWKQDGTAPIRYADLTEYLQEGENTLKFRVTADGQGRIAAIGKLLLRYEGGEEVCFAVNERWKALYKETQVSAVIIGTYGDEPWGKPKRRGPAPLLRKEFEVAGNVQKARLYICGLGYSVCTINGRPVTDAVLQTEYSQYHKTVYYHALDVTGVLRTGKNCLGVELGRGYYSYHQDWIGVMAEQDEPKLLLQLMIWQTDGSCQTVISGSDWKTIDGPTVDDNIWYGEKYDARLLPDGWDKPDFDDSGWREVRLMRVPGGKLRAAGLPPIRVVEQLLPTHIDVPAKKIRVYDFGKITTGWVRIFVKEPSGTRIKLTYGEKLLENGRVDMQTKCAVFQFWETGQTDIFVCRGGGENWTPKFSYKGFRYVEVEGLDHEITITGLSLHNDLRRTGYFNCSNELFNQIHNLITPTILNNFHSIPTDTPTYEKRGWTGDGQLICDTALQNLDAQTFFRKWLQDLADSQNEEGAIPDTCPGPVYYPPAPEWMCAMVVIPYYLYLYCGDEAVLGMYYPEMKRYMDYEIGRLQDGLSSNLHYGDWNSPAGSNPPEGSAFNATCFVYWILSVMENISCLLGKEADAVRYRTAAQSMRRTINRGFFDEEQMLYHTEIPAGFRQTPTVLPLAFDIAPSKKRKAIAASLSENIRVKDKNHLSTGCMGLKFLAPVLTEYGCADTAYSIVNQTDCPGWGYWLAKGATTCWETWDTDSRSYNHFYFGTIDNWFYQYLAGIRPVMAGYKTFRVRPYPCGDLTEVTASVETPYGIIFVRWEKADDMFSIDVTVPVNTTAEIVMPDGRAYQAGSGDHHYEGTI